MSTPLPVSLTPVSREDDGFLDEVYASTRWEELALTGWSDALKADFCRLQHRAQTAHYQAHYPGAGRWVILHGGQPAGRLYVDRWEREIRIMDLALLPDHRGQGLGTHLLRELIEEAAAAGKVLSIHVERQNPALRLYQRLGFEPAEDKGIYLLLECPPPARTQPSTPV